MKGPSTKLTHPPLHSCKKPLSRGGVWKAGGLWISASKLKLCQLKGGVQFGPSHSWTGWILCRSHLVVACEVQLGSDGSGRCDSSKNEMRKLEGERGQERELEVFPGYQHRQPSPLRLPALAQTLLEIKTASTPTQLLQPHPPTLSLNQAAREPG